MNGLSDKMVNVLISTFNGERFIEQQIESILTQSYENYHIYVRDDGSDDMTIQKVERYLKTGKVTLYKGKNIGFAQSFLELLQISDFGDYWAFCDQDDVWHKDKLKWSVDWMERQNSIKPCLFHSAFENVDIDLQHISFYKPISSKYDFRRALTECRYFGFSMVINSALRSLMLKGNAQNIVSHDWWAQLIAVKFGVCEFDSRVASKHRRHMDSITLDNGKKKIHWLEKSLKDGNRIANNAEEFERIFEGDLTSLDKKILRFFTHKTIGGNITRAFYLKRWRPTLISEVILRSLMLIGKS